MGYALRPGLSYCSANGRTAFLDTVADRYFCLPRPIDELFQTYLKGSPREDLPDDLVDAFKKQGLLIDDSATDLTRFCPQLKPPRQEVPIWRERPARRLAVIEAAFDRAMAAHFVKSRPLHTLLDACQRKARRTETRVLPELSGRLFADLQAFQVSARLVSSFNQCLSSSIALTRFLGRRRLYPNLVLGVRMAPFAAHAWVQADDLVLNDTVDMASRYTPILVI